MSHFIAAFFSLAFITAAFASPLHVRGIRPVCPPETFKPADPAFQNAALIH